MLTVKWKVLITKEGCKSTGLTIETTAHTVPEASNKMNDLLRSFLDDGWELQFSSIEEIKQT